MKHCLRFSYFFRWLSNFKTHCKTEVIYDKTTCTMCTSTLRLGLRGVFRTHILVSKKRILCTKICVQKMHLRCPIDMYGNTHQWGAWCTFLLVALIRYATRKRTRVHVYYLCILRVNSAWKMLWELGIELALLDGVT